MAKQQKVLYLDCLSGISGDMLLGALVDAGVPFEILEQAISSLGIDHLTLSQEDVHRGGFRAKKIHVHLPHEHAHRHLSDILVIIGRASISEKAREIATAIFTRLAEAEGKVHGKSPDHVHFHEVGAADSIADIVGLSVGFDFLAADQIICSPITTGTGTVRIAHGVCSVPAPATVELLVGIPAVSGDVPFELATPTGVAAIAVLANGFGPMPAMTLEKIGLGAGTRIIPDRPNLLRLLVGMADSIDLSNTSPSESLWMLETNLDDMTGEAIAWLLERLWSLNPRDVFTTPIQMKKQRPGTMISVLAESQQVAELEQMIFRESSTLGIRRRQVERTELVRRSVSVDTPWGKVNGKEAILPDGTVRFKPEFEDLATLARANGVTLETIRQSLCSAVSIK